MYRYVNTFGPFRDAAVGEPVSEKADPEVIRAYINELLKASKGNVATEQAGEKEPSTD